MTAKIPGIKIPYLKEAQYPEPETTRCIQIVIPDDDTFLAPLRGFLNALGRGFNYERTDWAKAQRVAELWRKAYNETDWEGCMDCERVADCIANDAGTRDALRDWWQKAQDGDVNGQKPSDQKLDENAAGDNPDCDNDIGFGHIRDGLVERSFQRSIDFLEQVAVTTNNQQMLSDGLNAVPVLGEVLGVVGVASWIAFYDDIRTWLQDAFIAQDTVDLRDQIACDLFCIWQENCGLTTRQIRNYYVGKIAPDFPSLAEALGAGIVELAGALGSLIEDVSSFAVYILMAAQYGFIAEINDWFSGINIHAVANDLLVGEANNDWTFLCDVCPGCYLWDFDVSAGEWVLMQGSYGVLADLTTGYLGEIIGSELRITIQYNFASPVRINNVTLVSFHADFYVTLDTSAGAIITDEYHPFAALETISTDTLKTGVTWLKVQLVRSVADGYIDLRSVQIDYQGVEPTGGDVC